MKKKEIKKRYQHEVSAVDNVIETLSDALESCGPYSFTDEDCTREVSREEALEAIIEWSLEKLSGNVGYVFLKNKELEG